MDEDNRRIMRGEQPAPAEDSENAVTAAPPQLREWVEKNADRIRRAEKRGTLPHFLRDNREAAGDVMRANGTYTEVMEKAHKATAQQTSGVAFVSFEPFSPVIISKIKEISDRRKRATLFHEILNDDRAELLHIDTKSKARTTCFKEHHGRKTRSWDATREMAKDLNRHGRSVCFLPEYEETTSADAIIQFQKQWRIADFKHSTKDNYNTIATDLAKGFTQARCVVLKMENGNLNTLKRIIDQLHRHNSEIGDFVLINKYGKVKEVQAKHVNGGEYVRLLRGFF